MEHKLNNFKADLHDVFVQGTASSSQIARVFIIIAPTIIGICVWALR